MPGIASLLRFIWNHPLNRADRFGAIGRLARWQVAARIAPGPLVFPFAEETFLLASKGMTGATGNYYCGLHEIDDMGFVLHALRPNDLFLDVGSNIGSYTVLAAGAVGSRAIAVEPIPATFENLRRNVFLNGLEDCVQLVCKGLGSSDGELRFTSDLDSENRVAADAESFGCITVPVTTIDQLCSEAVPAVIKIDVEGFESQVIAGASKTLSADALLAVVMETNGSGARYGMSDQVLTVEMRRFGFIPCGYDAITREIAVEVQRLAGNTILCETRRRSVGG